MQCRVRIDGRRGRFHAAMAAVLGIALLITGCSLVPDGLVPWLESESSGQASDVPLTVHADESAWLSPEYAAGAGEPVDAEATLCGFTDGLRIHSIANEEMLRVEALDLATGELAWAVDGVLCSMYSVVASEVIMFGPSETEGHIQIGRVNAATGEGEAYHLAELLDPLAVRVVSADDDIIVVQLEDQWMEQRLLALDDTGQEIWTYGPTAFTYCHPLDGFVGCEIDGTAITVIEMTTGRVSVDQQTVSGEVTWASDGYAVSAAAVESEGPTAEIFDLEGASLGVVDCCLAAAPGVMSADIHSATVPLAELGRTEVLAVAPDGEPLVVRGEDLPVYRDGEPLSAPQVPKSITPDGETLLRGPGTLQGPDQLVGRESGLLAEIEGEFVEIAYGYIVVRAIGTDQSYRFIPPAR